MYELLLIISNIFVKYADHDMDWTQIIVTALTLLITGGGLVTIVTLGDRKTAALLGNIEKILQSNSETNKEWKEIAAERAGRCGELKTDIDRKDDKIDEIYKEKEHLAKELDDLRTAKAISDVLRCTRTGCADRHPPFGQGLNLDVCKDCKTKEVD